VEKSTISRIQRSLYRLTQSTPTKAPFTMPG
jgi:hypothetical protein